VLGGHPDEAHAVPALDQGAVAGEVDGEAPFVEGSCPGRAVEGEHRDEGISYLPFAAAHGLAVIRLRPGGTDQLNPWTAGPSPPLRTGQAPFTLADLATALANPTDEAAELTAAAATTSPRAATPVVLALDKHCTRTLAGMFDGPTTIDID
jgi:hypothetical protein